MATKTIAWKSGGGYITLTYTGIGNAPISVKSDANELFEDREQTVQIVTAEGTPQKTVNLLIRQKGKTYPAGTTFNFDYTGSVQEITLPPGKYKLQCWGAQGGSVSGSYTAAGSKGGYSEGVLTITEPTTIYVFVGGNGTDSSTSSTSGTANGGWNGGGASVRYSSYNSGNTFGKSYPRPGGGATDMCLVTSTMAYSSGRTNRSSASLLSRFIVAGGGAGASARYTEETDTVEHTNYDTVDSGVVRYSWFTGTYYTYYKSYLSGLSYNKKYRVVMSGDNNYGAGDIFIQVKDLNGTWVKNITTITSSFTASSDPSDYHYELVVRNKVNATSTYNYTLEEITTTTDTTTSTSSGKSNASQQGGGATGRGQYPGKQNTAGSGGEFGLGANQTTTNYRYDAGAGGGGWYGGGTGHSDSSTGYVNYSGGGSGFVNTAANAGYRPSGYTGLQMDSGSTTAGNSSHPNTSGGTETGHSGNGYARITVIE